jgi:hypothetical protein
MAEKAKKASSFKAFFFRDKEGGERKEADDQSPDGRDFDFAIPGELKDVISQPPGSGKIPFPVSKEKEERSDTAPARKTAPVVTSPVPGDTRSGSKETPVFEPAKKTVTLQPSLSMT